MHPRSIGSPLFSADLSALAGEDVPQWSENRKDEQLSHG